MDTLPLLYNLSFWAFAGLMIAGALGVVFHRSIVYSALLLLVTFLSIAAVFVLLNAPFIAAAQILVYGVGLTIVLIFGIMLTGDKPFQDPVGQERPNRFWIVPAIISVAFLSFMIWALLSPDIIHNTVNGLFVERVDPTTAGNLPGVQAIRLDAGLSHIGEMLFSNYLIPFELASVLLLLAMMGAIILSKRQFPEEEGEAPIERDVEAIPGSTADAVNIAQPVGTHSAAAVDEASEKETLGVH